MERMLRRSGNGGESFKSPEEIEEGIKSIKTVKWDPFIVFPKEIYLEIFEKLENPDDKQNFMNAHIKWYHLFESKRILFLSQQVFKVVGVADNEPWRWGRNHRHNPQPDRYIPEGAGDESDYEKLTYMDLLKCRLVCHDWDKGIQNYFQLHDNRFRLNDGMQIWNSPLRMPRYQDDTNVLVPCKTFSWHVARSFPAEDALRRFSITHPPSKNPIMPRSVVLSPCVEFRGVRMLSRPGQSYMPPLGASYLIRDRASIDALLERYGQHIWHCKFAIELKLFPETLDVISKWLSLMPELKTLELEYEEEVCDVVPFTKKEWKAFQLVKVEKPELDKLVVLKSSNLPSVVFNKLFGELPELEKIQIMAFRGKDSGLRNFTVPTDQKNLREAFFTVKGLPDFRHLSRAEPFPNLKSLVITLEFERKDEHSNTEYLKWPEWKLVWNVLEEKFPKLEKLTLRLPKAAKVNEKEEAIQQSLECRLNLVKLKKLWVAMPNLCSLDFLLPCKALEELEIVLEHSQRYSDRSWRLGKIEKVDFNSFLQSMWNSNIWGEFSKLKKLEIKCLDRVEGVSGNFYRYEKIGNEKKYKTGTF